MRDDVRDVLQRAAGWYPPQNPDPAMVRRESARRHRNRRLTAAVVAITLTVGAVGSVYAVLDPWASPRPQKPSGDRAQSLDERIADLSARVNEANDAVQQNQRQMLRVAEEPAGPAREAKLAELSDEQRVLIGDLRSLQEELAVLSEQKQRQLLSGQYRFVDVRIVSQDANSATVSYGIAWATADYPGVRRCTWTAIGSDGSRVGSLSDKVVSLSPTVPGTNVKTDIPIRSEAQKVKVSCGERLDTGEPYEYEFSDIVVQEPLELSFRYRWLGPAAPGAVSCVAMVLAPDGTIKAQTRSNLFSLLRKGEGSFRFDRSQVSVGESEPSRLEGEIDCVPYE